MLCDAKMQQGAVRRPVARKQAGVRMLLGVAVLLLVRIGPPAAAQATPAAEAAAAPVITLVVRNARVYDGQRATLTAPTSIWIAADRVAAIGFEPAGVTLSASSRMLDAGGRIAMPGLIDAHMHPMVIAGFDDLKGMDANYVMARAAASAQATLLRGFTTVRDLGGPSFGLKQAIDEGLIAGPRIFPSGAIVSQSGGHGDFRSRAAGAQYRGEPDILEQRGYTARVDGVDQVLTAVREQLRLGATQIKLAAGGGISTPLNPLDSVQLLDEEMRAAVRAAADYGTYVTVHAYTPQSLRRALDAGVRCVEHAHLIDEPTMKLIAERGVFVSTQAYAFSGVFARPPAPGSPPPTAAQLFVRAKAERVQAGLDRMMTLAKKHGAKVAFGTDLFGSERVVSLQPKEFGARLKWFTSAEILQQATGINGELLSMSGTRNPYAGPVGVLTPGAMADLLIVDGNPLEDVRVLEEPDKNLLVIVKDGVVVKERLPEN
ncbi:MAG: amidohydrolase family protein [Steroidobacteraceae bacterium]